TVVRHPQNLGYGGNQKWGYQYAMDHGWDIVVLLHGDGQYAPEMLAEMVAPIEEGRAEAVFGSRIMEPGEARKGGMPAYKYLGNRVLTTMQNKVAGTQLTEWHSGYRAYSVDALRSLPLAPNDDGFNFDTQIILQLHEAGHRIAEIPIPTYYGDEICYVDGIKYAKDVTRDVVRYRAHKMGFGTGEMAFSDDGYELKESDDSSHGRIEQWLRDRPPSRILDLGCADGSFGARLVAAGHEVIGVDIEEHKGVRDRLTDFVEADLDHGIPAEVGADFDLVLAADVLEHVASPERLLHDVRARVRPGGTVIASVPNFGHWYPRLRVAAGRFDYDKRGILDRGHVRFFTRRSLDGVIERAGWRVLRTESIGLPFDIVDRGGHGDAPRARSLLAQVDRAAIALRPPLFAYQFLVELG
ncbi:MAG TPA: bifunctional glycosyltransferase/class I SAM-dependent methyltransferase, partial [Acidimicrobiia bacterium]|nr:bifunctional glycosyltransferase/class I SAM-dependent methyltransferase [Acidimicrobiia bacterium]